MTIHGNSQHEELLTLLTKKSRITEEQLCKKYPIFKTIYRAVLEFKNIFKAKDWVVNTKQLHIPEMDSFILRLERDF